MDMKTICRNQVEEAKKHKWILGQKLGYDPGEKAIEDWVNKYAKIYREEYNMCYESTKKKVLANIKAKIEKGELKVDDMAVFVSIIVDEFTTLWVKECALTEDKHLKEI